MNRVLRFVPAFVFVVGALSACQAASNRGTNSGGGGGMAYALGGSGCTVDLRPPVPVSAGYALPAPNSHSFMMEVKPEIAGTTVTLYDPAGGLIATSTSTVKLEFIFDEGSDKLELKVDTVSKYTDYKKIGTITSACDPIVEPYTTNFPMSRKERVTFTMFGATTYFDVKAN